MINELIDINKNSKKEIKDLIFVIRGKQVMLDSDLAELFQTTVSLLNRQVKRNIDRFPTDFCFKINKEELGNLRCQNGTANSLSSKRRYNPYVFTEHGVIALAAVLKSEVATKMSVKIVRTFVEMKNLIQGNELIQTIARIQNRQIEFEDWTKDQINQLLLKFEKVDLAKAILIYNGKSYDAAEYVTDLILRAKTLILLVDPYVDSKALNYLKHKNGGVKATIVKSPSSKLSEIDISNFVNQYGDIKVNTLDNFHDRFLVIDNEECYQFGTSINHMGNKVFSIIKVESKRFIEDVINTFDQ